MFRPLRRLFIGHVCHTVPGDSKAPKVKQSTSDTEPTAVAAATSILPQEIIDEILDHLAADTDQDPRLEFSLRSCSLVCKSWVEPCWWHLFYKLYFNAERMRKWLQAFPVPEQSPARHVRRIHLNFAGSDDVLHKITESIQGFTNLKSINVSRDRERQPMWMPLLVGLPQSVTSLRIMENLITLWQIREIITQLPNLNDLYLSGALTVMDRNKVQGVGKTLTAKFGGRLRLCPVDSPVSSDVDIVNMLLEIPTGLHFTYVRSWACFSSTVRIVEACSKTLVTLVYVIHNEAPVDHEGLNRTFDFAESPNLEELTFEVRPTAGDISWIPRALSTVKPITSPCFSVLNLIPRDEPPHPSVPAYLTLRLKNVTRLTEEISRIKHEFMGEVTVTAPLYPEV